MFNASLFVMKVRESARSHFSSLRDFFKHVLIDELPQQILSPFLTWENCSFPVEFFRCRAGGWWSFALYTSKVLHPAAFLLEISEKLDVFLYLPHCRKLLLSLNLYQNFSLFLIFCHLSVTCLCVRL